MNGTTTSPRRPILVSVTKGGKTIDAVAATNKTGYVYVFDRESGQSLFPIDEVPAPPAHRAGATLPGPPSRGPQLPPALVAPDGVGGRTHAAYARSQQMGRGEKFATYLNGPPFTPPAYSRENRVGAGLFGGERMGRHEL